MNLQILRNIARELDGLDTDDATLLESNIAQLLINAGLLKEETHSTDDNKKNWREYKST
jgi:hypothetical protein